MILVLRAAQAFAVLALVAALTSACNETDSESSEGRTPKGPTPVLGGIAEEFYETLLLAPVTVFKATYRTSSSEGRPGDTLIVYNKPPFTRIDTIPADPADLTSILIGGAENTRTISCLGRPESWECEAVDALGPSLLRTAGPIVFLTPSEIVAYNVLETEARTIAGEQARCFRLQAQTPDVDEVRYCFAQDGIPLFSAPVFGIVEATEVSREVSDDVFEPPAPAE